MALSNRKPSMDAELRKGLENVSLPAISHATPEVIEMMRRATATPPSYLEDLKSQGISHREVRIPKKDGSNSEIILSILQPVSESNKPRPCMYWIHGGGLHWGDRLHTLEFPSDVVLEYDAICVSVEYGLAPEHSLSEALEDCYAGLEWTSEHMEELGIDANRLMIGGSSAGGLLATSTALLCRDREGPVLCAQCLICPMLDDRLSTASCQQYTENSDFLPSSLFEDVWKSSLKKDRESSSAGIIIPGRIEDLSRLPTTYLDVGSAEVLRDDVVAYASKLWTNGIQAELHVWAGGFHGFDIFLPDVAVSQASRKAKMAWVKKVFGSNQS
ncbi:esterase LipW [Coleophoma cylindrospora]|uniref:Esterase LipW n=1 Tax=Coleophoma cylindrospora TaxID=1849047 RepID=A0A3D8RVB2_9HELO|nr:esterase LipW [Coleophoma cylindrospora]